MPEKISTQLRQLIAENEPRRAAELLYEKFGGRNEQLAKLALVQINSQKRLFDQVAAGVLTQAETNTEQNKINQALLYLADEYARLYETGAKPAARSNRLIWLIAAAAVLVVTALFALKNWSGKAPAADESFSLEVRLHGPKGEQDVISNGKVNIRLGDVLPRDPQTLDAEGRAWFRDLGGKYLRDTVFLTYFPDNGRAYRLVNQSASTASQSKTIRFTLETQPDTTLIRYSLRDKKGPLAGADVTIDGAIVVKTDAKGYFQAAIPKASGEQAHLLIEKNGRRIFEQDFSISPDFKTLPVE